MITFIKKNMTYPIKYLTVGGISAVFYFTIFAVCAHLMPAHYMLSASLAYFVSVCVHFLGNNHFTFSYPKASVLRFVIVKYITMLSVNYGISMFVIYTVVEKWGRSPYDGIIASIAATVSIGFLLARYWVFAWRGREG